MEVKKLLFDEVIAWNDNNLQKLKHSLKDNQYTFCLGAGVSISAGLPDWYTLLSKIIGRLLYLSNNEKLDDQTGKKGYSTYKAAKHEMFMQHASEKEFQNKLKQAYRGEYNYMLQGEDTLELAEAIYEFILESVSVDGIDIPQGMEAKWIEQDKSELTDFYIKQFVKEICTPKKEIWELESKAIGAIVKILVEINPDIEKEVITYNYDNLLEECLRVIGKVKDSEIYSYGNSKEAGVKKKDVKYHIYHVHGFLPVTDHDQKFESEKIVLTENSYTDIEKMGYDWVNVIQSYKYHTSNLIFIGFSGQDYNFRRILRSLSVGKQNHHYIFICIDDIVKRVFKKLIDDMTTLEFETLFSDKDRLQKKYPFELIMLNQMLSAKSIYWEKHGLIPIWTTIAELPKVLLGLR